MSWKTLPLGEVVVFQRGFDLPSSKRQDGDIPIVSSSGITDYHNVGPIKAPGIITGRYGTIGKVFLLEEDFWPLNTTLYVKEFHKNIPQFIFYLLQTFRFEEFSGKTGVPGVNRNELHSEFVILPPLPEQRAIASALADMDALLDSLEELLTKKRQLKLAAMQELLTGKTRLEGFEGEWEEKTVADLCAQIIDYRGRTPLKMGMEWGSGDIAALSAGNVKMGFVDFDAECYLGSEKLYKRWMTAGELEKGDIIFTTEAPLGNVALIPDGKKYILSQRVIALKIRRLIFDNAFLLQKILSTEFQELLMTNSSGSTAQGIKRKVFEKLVLFIPCLPEQKAIAAILSEMDAELEALEERVAKTRDLKEGMMQELLTGRTRLL